MKYITGDKWLRVTGYWLMVIGLILIAGCSSDSTGTGSDGMDVSRQGHPLQVVPYTANYQATDFQMRDVTAGYSAYTPDHEIAIGLYVLEGGNIPETPEVKLISYSNKDWHSQAMVEENKEYTIYGYMPKKDPISSSISKSGDVVTLTLSNISTVSADDICFILCGKILFEFEGTGSGDRAQIVFQFLFIHTDTVIADGYDPLFLIHVDVDLRIFIHGGKICQGNDVSLIQRIGSVGDQFSQEDIGIGIDGIRHHVQQTFRFCLKLFYSHILLPPSNELALYTSDC